MNPERSPQTQPVDTQHVLRVSGVVLVIEKSRQGVSVVGVVALVAGLLAVEAVVSEVRVVAERVIDALEAGLLAGEAEKSRRGVPLVGVVALVAGLLAIEAVVSEIRVVAV